MKMIKLSSDHYIVVDDSEIKEGDWVFNEKSKEIYPITIIEEVVYYEKKITHSTQPLGKPMLFTNAFESDLAITTMGLHDTVIENWGCKKLSLLEVKELIGEVDAEQYAWDNPVLSRKDVYELFNNVFKDKTIEGAYRLSASKQVYQFNAQLRELAKQRALEDNKDRKYTEESVLMILQKTARKYFKEGREYKGNMAIAGDPLHGLRSELREYLQSLQPKTEWEVEIVDGKLKLKQ